MYNYRVLDLNKSVLNWTFCQLLSEKPNCTKLFLCYIKMCCSSRAKASCSVLDCDFKTGKGAARQGKLSLKENLVFVPCFAGRMNKNLEMRFF